MKYKQGQTLITLLVFIIIFLTITSAAVIMLSSNSVSTDTFQQSIAAKEIAESGIENALLRLLRNPDYTGETLTVGDGNVIITVTGDAVNKIIISKGKLGNFQRIIQTNITYNNGMLNITSWKEIP